MTDDGVDAETSLSLPLHLYLSSPPLHFILMLTYGQTSSRIIVVSVDWEPEIYAS